MPDSTGYCHKCGNALPPGATFCPRCGAAVSASSSAPSPQQPTTPRRGEKNEKNEKHEKQEKNEKGEKSSGSGILGALVGGSVLIWLGITFFLEQNGYLPSNIWWAYFLAGVGVVLVLDGVVIYSRGHIGIGPLIGGTLLVFAGLSAITTDNYRVNTELWPLAIVALGIIVLVSGVVFRRRVPRPSA